MPSVIVCPECTGQLRLPDELIGQQVRCPTCSHVFVAGLKPPPVPAAPVDLSLGNGHNRDTEPVPKPRGLVGAVEMKLSLDDDGPAPRSSEPSRPSSAPVPRARHDERDDDERPCPACGKRIHHDADRCYHCGWRKDEFRNPSRSHSSDNDSDDVPLRNRNPERRDLAPSRGVMILILGILSLVATMMSPVALVLGLIAWILGHSDLNRMKAQEMEEDGGLTRGGWICGMIGTLLNCVVTLSCLGLFSAALLENNSRPAATYKKPVMVAPNGGPLPPAPMQKNGPGPVGPGGPPFPGNQDKAKDKV